MSDAPHGTYAERLSPDNAACVLLDHQSGMLRMSPSIDAGVLRNNIIGLAKMANAFSLPTVLTQSWPDGPNGPTLPELVSLFPGHPILARTAVNAWDAPDFVEAVKTTGRRKLIMAGLTLEVCVALPAVSAVRAGYEVYAVVDASGSWSRLVDHVTMTRLTHAGVVVTTFVAVLAELAYGVPGGGKHIAAILQRHVGFYGAAYANFMAAIRATDHIVKRPT